VRKETKHKLIIIITAKKSFPIATVAEMEKSQNGEENSQLNLSNDGSICGYDSLHHLLKDNLNPRLFQVILLSNQSLLLLLYQYLYFNFIGSCSSYMTLTFLDYVFIAIVSEQLSDFIFHSHVLAFGYY